MENELDISKLIAFHDHSKELDCGHFANVSDRVYLRSTADVSDDPIENIKEITDFAVINNSTSSNQFGDKTINCGKYFLQVCDENTPNYFNKIDGEGNRINVGVSSPFCGVCPVMDIKLPDKDSFGFKQLLSKIYCERDFRGKECHYIDLGSYPSTLADTDTQKALFTAFNYGYLSKDIICTKKLYTTVSTHSTFSDYNVKPCPEFEYFGKKYVLSGNWYQVEPIKFKVLNYDDVMSGKSDTIKVESDKILISGIAYSPLFSEANKTMWQNSPIRYFLNSAKVGDLPRDDRYACNIGWDFSSSGFLHDAFDINSTPCTEYFVHKDVNGLSAETFDGCVGIEKLHIHAGVGFIDEKAFDNLVDTQIIFDEMHPNINLTKQTFLECNCKYLYIQPDSNTVIFSPYVDKQLENDFVRLDLDSEIDDLNQVLKPRFKQNLSQVLQWKKDGKVRFVPPKYTLRTFPETQISKYFLNKNNHRWARLVSAVQLDDIAEPFKGQTLSNLMKIYYAIGGFSENQGESETAFDYIISNVACLKGAGKKFFDPIKFGTMLHEKFSQIELTGPYNPMFAKFFMKYYESNPDFMLCELTDQNGYLLPKKDYLCDAHNKFDKILEKYPNMMLKGNERNSLITPEFVAKQCLVFEYDNVHKGNEELAKIVSAYGYTQKVFDKMQQIFELAKEIEDKSVLRAGAPSGKHDIEFRLLKKSDPTGFVLGDQTNCCQRFGKAGESCVVDGYINPNAGFVVFEKNKRDENGQISGKKELLGQCYTWYDPVTKTVCFDNIEIPTKVMESLRKGKGADELVDAICECANSMCNAINNSGVPVKTVTMGEGFNNISGDLQKRFGFAKQKDLAENRGYLGYTDANRGQFVLKTYEGTTAMLSASTKKTAKSILSDIANVIDQIRGNNGLEK